jgi:hypothetical protein
MHLDGQPSGACWPAPGGVLWYGCDTDLCRMQNGKTTHLRDPLNLPEERWHGCCLRATDNSGSAAPRMRARCPLQPTASRSTIFPAAPTPCPTPHSPRNRTGGSSLAGFRFWSLGGNPVAHGDGHERPHPLRHLGAVCRSRRLSLWIGVVGHGLMQWVGQNRWEAYTAANGLSDDIVWCTLSDSAAASGSAPNPVWICCFPAPPPRNHGRRPASRRPVPIPCRKRGRQHLDGFGNWKSGAYRSPDSFRDAMEGAGGLSYSQRRRSHLGSHGRRPLRCGYQVLGPFSAPCRRPGDCPPAPAVHRFGPRSEVRQPVKARAITCGPQRTQDF